MNFEQLSILRSGVKNWNAWRLEHDEKIDLEGANLREADLEGANLAQANFFKANLDAANLRGANLEEAELGYANCGFACFDNANLTCARVSNMYLQHASLCGTDLSDTYGEGLYLEQASLAGAKLRRAQISSGNHGGNSDFRWANLSRADLTKASLNFADLHKANLEHATLIGASFNGASLYQTKLQGADLTHADLTNANLHEADFRRATLSGVNLQRARLVETDLREADLTGAWVYGAAVWNVKLEGATQRDLKITDMSSPVTVDNLEVAQFVHLLLKNDKIRGIIDTIGEKGVLILGRFTPERKAVLDAVRGRLRDLGFVPMMFDFDRPTQRDFTETIKTLAGLSRFIIADITNPSSSPLELQATMPDYMIPFVPIIQENEKPFAMFSDLAQKYEDWVLELLEYDSPKNLTDVLEAAVIRPAIERADKLLLKKAEAIRTRHVADYRKS